VMLEHFNVFSFRLFWGFWHDEFHFLIHAI